ncbi:MAG: hypothetical protein WAP47_21730 [Candidatus Rokuibacteriota bacterium]
MKERTDQLVKEVEEALRAKYPGFNISVRLASAMQQFDQFSATLDVSLSGPAYLSGGKKK